jgi:hypothetical protein
MDKRGWDFWDLVILIGALIILFWALAKALKIIATPIWVDTLPYFGVGFAIIGGVYKLGIIKRGIDETERKVDKILTIEERFNKLENEHKLAMDGKLKIQH